MQRLHRFDRPNRRDAAMHLCRQCAPHLHRLLREDVR
jgi:hypothetical protein